MTLMMEEKDVENPQVVEMFLAEANTYLMSCVDRKQIELQYEKFYNNMKICRFESFVKHLTTLLQRNRLTPSQIHDIAIDFVAKKKAATAPVDKKEPADKPAAVRVKPEPVDAGGAGGAAEAVSAPGPAVAAAGPVQALGPAAAAEAVQAPRAAEAAPAPVPAGDAGGAGGAGGAGPNQAPAAPAPVPVGGAGKKNVDPPPAAAPVSKRPRIADPADNEPVQIHGNQTITVKQLKEMSKDELKKETALQQEEFKEKRDNQEKAKNALTIVRTQTEDALKMYLQALENEKKAMATYETTTVDYTKVEQVLGQFTAAVVNHCGAGH